MVFRLTVIRNSYFPAFNARCVGGSDRIPELRNRHTIPSTPQLPLRGAQQLAQMYIDEGHTLTWPTSSECDGINSQTMKAAFRDTEDHREIDMDNHRHKFFLLSSKSTIQTNSLS